MLEYFGKEAKGYEMEGFSIAAGAIDCIIVKGVCDFACDKDKTWQPTAALAAIDCLHNDLDKMDLSLMKNFIQKGTYIVCLYNHRYYTLRYRIGSSGSRMFTPRCSGSVKLSLINHVFPYYTVCQIVYLLFLYF